MKSFKHISRNEKWPLPRTLGSDGATEKFPQSHCGLCILWDAPSPGHTVVQWLDGFTVKTRHDREKDGVTPAPGTQQERSRKSSGFQLEWELLNSSSCSCHTSCIFGIYLSSLLIIKSVIMNHSGFYWLHVTNYLTEWADNKADWYVITPACWWSEEQGRGGSGYSTDSHWGAGYDLPACQGGNLQ